MIDFNVPVQQIAGLTVFSDHADDRVHYVVPTIPSLVVLSQKPQFSLSLFRGEQQGALLNFEAMLEPTEEQMRLLKEHFVAREEPIFVSPDWRDGRVQLAGWYIDDEKVPSYLTQSSLSLLGAPRTLVSARLNEKETAIAVSALHDATLPLALIFELETLALAGSLAVRAEADLTALHDRLTAKGALQAPMTKAQIQATWEEALQEGAIRIEITDQTVDEDLSRAQAMYRIGEHLILNMLSPHPPAEAPAMFDDQPIAAVELSFRLTMRRETLSTTAVFDFNERRPVVMRHYAAANMIGLIKPEDLPGLIHTVDLHPSSRSIVIRSEPELEALSMSAIEVDIRLSGDSAFKETVLLTDTAPEAFYETRSGWNEAIDYRVRARYDTSVTGIASRTSDWFTFSGGSVLLSPRRLFPERESRLLLGSGETDWLDHVKVVFELPDEGTRSALLNAHERQVYLRWPGLDELALPAHVHWAGNAEEPSSSEARLLTLEGDTLLDSPFGESIHIFAAPLPLSDVISLLLEVQYDDPIIPQEKTAEWSDQDRRPVTLPIRRFKGSDLHFRYRTTKVMADGNLVQSDWISTLTSQLVIGADFPVKIHRVTAVLLGGVESRGAVAAEIVLTAGPVTSRQVLEGHAERADMVLMTPPDHQEIRLLVTEFLVDGGSRKTEINQPDELTVISMPQASSRLVETEP